MLKKTIITLILLVSTNLNSQSKKETFDFIIEMVKKQNFWMDNHNRNTNIEIISRNYSDFTCVVVQTTRIYENTYNCDYCIEKEVLRYKLDFNRVINVSPNPVNQAPSAGGFTVYYNNGDKVNISGAYYYNSGRIETFNEYNHRPKMYTFKYKEDAMKMYKALMHLKKITGFNPDLF